MKTENRINTTLIKLTTPLIADACIKLGIVYRLAPFGIRSTIPGVRVGGRVQPVKHFGSVDVFLEAIENGSVNDILVIDNQGRKDEACIGDLTALEVQIGKMAGIIVWGLHRDTAELIKIKLPVFSYGTFPSRPLRLEKQSNDVFNSIQFGSFNVTTNDIVFADDDGVIFFPTNKFDSITNEAQAIQFTEEKQALDIKNGISLREKLKFSEYLQKRKLDPSYNFRQHLREIGGEIEQ